MRASQPEMLVIRRQGRGHGGIGTADPLQPQRDLGVIPVQLVTTVAADDLESVPVATFPSALREQNRLTPDARRNAVSALTSNRDSHNTTGRSAARRIAGMPPAPHPDALGTASGPGTGLGLRRCDAQLGPHISRLCHCRGLEQRLWLLPVWLRDRCGGNCRPVAATTVPPALRPRVFSCAECLASSVPVLPVVLAGAEIPAGGCRDRVQGNPGPYPISYTPDSAVDQIRALRMSLQNKPTVSQTAPLRLTTSSYPCAVQAARDGTPPPGCTCRIRRVTTQGRPLRACGPELDDMNAVTTVGRPSWRA